MLFDAFVSFEDIILEVVKDCFESDGAGEKEEYSTANNKQKTLETEIA